MAFGDASFIFLERLAANNNRDWFAEHKEQYEDLIQEPALNLVAELIAPMAAISTAFIASPKKIGGSLMRVYRDTRFAHDKTPYKTNIGIQLRHEAGKDVHAPGFYLHIAADECFLGVGIWRPDNICLSKIRSYINDNPDAWQLVRNNKKFRQYFSFGGGSLTRLPRGYAVDHPHAEDLRRKDHIAICPLSREQVLNKKFVSTVMTRYTASAVFMHWLCDALELRWLD